jgi:hypothetical protein
MPAVFKWYQNSLNSVNIRNQGSPFVRRHPKMMRGDFSFAILKNLSELFKKPN